MAAFACIYEESFLALQTVKYIININKATTNHLKYLLNKAGLLRACLCQHSNLKIVC